MKREKNRTPAFVESACTWEERCSPVKSAESCQSGYIHLCKQTLSASVLSAIKSGKNSLRPCRCSHLARHPEQVIL